VSEQKIFFQLHLRARLVPILGAGYVQLERLVAGLEVLGPVGPDVFGPEVVAPEQWEPGVAASPGEETCKMSLSYVKQEQSSLRKFKHGHKP